MDVLRSVFERLSKFAGLQNRCDALDAAPRVSDPVALVGDLHGRDDLFALMIEKLARHPAAAQMRVVLVGDLIDRGPESAEVLRRAYALIADPAPFRALTVLLGNHERMALDFLRDPLEYAPRWWAVGGDATLTSFGLSLPYNRQSASDAVNQVLDLRDALAERMGAEMVQWLSALPLFWQESDLFVAHAGADPGVPLRDQTEAALIWGRYRRAPGPRADGIWVAQGHLIQKQAKIDQGRILIDTGAWKTGRLSAVILSAGAPEIVDVSDAPAA